MPWARHGYKCMCMHVSPSSLAIITYRGFIIDSDTGYITRTIQEVQDDMYKFTIGQAMRVILKFMSKSASNVRDITHLIHTHKLPWEQSRQLLSWDIMGPLPATNWGKYILVVTDLFTKWVEAFLLRDTQPPPLWKRYILVDEIISRYGVPAYLHSD